MVVARRKVCRRWARTKPTGSERAGPRAGRESHGASEELEDAPRDWPQRQAGKLPRADRSHVPPLLERVSQLTPKSIAAQAGIPAPTTLFALPVASFFLKLSPSDSLACTL